MGKGSVSVQSVRGRLRLCWRFQGKRYWLALGYPDKVGHRKIAELKAAEIEADILYGRFDPANIEKYRSAGGTQNAEKSTPDYVSLRSVWTGFVEWKRSQCSPSTMRSDYRNYSRHVNKFPTDNIYEGVEIQRFLLKRVRKGETTIGSVKRLLVALNDMGNWAIRQGLIEYNAFAGMSKEIRVPKSVGEEYIDPFTAEERNAIIQGFKEHRYYRHYAPLVEFMFRCGCRPSEALGLTWRQVGPGYATILFDQALVEGEDGLEIKQGLKTQERRQIRLSESMQKLLKNHRPLKWEPDDLVFPAPRGGFITFQNFANRGWTVILQGCGLTYRNPYQTRHTFITLALQGGMNAKDVAKLVGNSAEMIHRHYLGVSRDLRLPEV